MKNFSETLNKWRKREKLSQPAAAEILGTTVHTLRGWLYGKHKPSAALMNVIEKTISLKEP